MISIKKYSDNLRYLWDDFILKSNSGTIFHKQRFIGYHVGRQFKDCSLLFFDNDSLFCVFPAALITKNKKTIISSHPGASYGGFIFNRACYSLYCRALSVFKKYCLHNNIDGVSFVAVPFVYYKQFNNMFEYVLYRHQYLDSGSYMSHVVF